jgi:hypothetical protein
MRGLIGPCFLLLNFLIVPLSAAQSAESDEAEANPGRPTVSTPATLTPVGYLQFETGVLGASHSPEFSSRYGFNEVMKLSVTPRLEFIAASYFRRVYDGEVPEVDFGSPRNSFLLLASADVKGFHYDANVIFNEQSQETVDRVQFSQTLSISHPIVGKLSLSGEIWHFTQPFLRGHAVGNLWAVSYAARKTLVFDAGFNRGLTSTSTRWEAFVGFTYLFPHRLW